MAYRKFDDAPLSRSNEARKLNPVLPNEGWRRALQGVFNRVIAGTSGTANGTGLYAGVGTATTAGIKTLYDVIIDINGRLGTAAARDNMYLPLGTQSKSTYVKYLVSVGFGTTGTVTAGNEGTSSTTAKLPDCPENHVAVGYLEYVTGTAGAFIRFGGGTAGGYNIVSGKTAGTEGTVSAWVNLLHMPMDES